MRLIFSNLFKIDHHTLYTLVYRFWGVIAGGATILVLPLYITPDAQGYYYTFSSLLALQVFFELGFNQVISLQVSHSYGFFKNDKLDDGFNDLLFFVHRWYLVVCILFLVLVGLGGVLFFSYKNDEATNNWIGIWLLLVIFNALNLWLSPNLAILEGFGKVGQVARLRFLQSFIGFALFWVALNLNFGIWAMVFIPATASISTYFWLYKMGAVPKYYKNKPTIGINWKKNILPMQWRIAVSWISGYLIFNLFNPIIFQKFGSIEAGKIGMSLSIFSAISTIGMSWVNAKSPEFAVYISEGKRKNLNILFRETFAKSLAAVFGMSILFILFILIFLKKNIYIAERIAPIDVLILLAVASVVNTAIFSMAIYMRAHKEEPMLFQTITCGVLIGFSTLYGSEISLIMIFILYVTVLTLISLPWTIITFNKYRKLV